jgi:hypothetical protein
VTQADLNVMAIESARDETLYQGEHTRVFRQTLVRAGKAASSARSRGGWMAQGGCATNGGYWSGWPGN